MVELVLLTTLWISKIDPTDVRVIFERVPKAECVMLATKKRQKIVSGRVKVWCDGRQI